MNEEYENNLQNTNREINMTNTPQYETNPVNPYSEAEKTPDFAENNNSSLNTGAAPYNAYQNEQPNVYAYPDPSPRFNEQTKKKNTVLKTVCIVLSSVLAFSGALILGFAYGKKSNNDISITEKQPISDFSGTEFDITVNSKPNAESKDNNGEMSATDIFEFVSPSIVEIYVYSSSKSDSYGYSSGIVMSKDGYILTNDHIYMNSVNPVIYVVVNGKNYKGTFVAGDMRRDISVIKINAENLTPATFGKSSELKMGETLYAIGNPKQLSESITSGIVSSLNRRISDSNGYIEKYIQTDTAISGGSSGGALVNEFGQIVGITSSKYVDTDSEGITFAIPIDEAILLTQDLMKNGKVTTRAKLGIQYNELNIAYADMNKCPMGIRIASVSKESSFAQTGIKKGDILTEINGKAIKSADVVLDVIEQSKPGDELTVKYWIADTGNYNTVKVKLIPEEGTSNYYLGEEEQKIISPFFPDEIY